MFHMRVIVCFRANWRTFQPKLKKINPYPLLKKKKKTKNEKNSLYFRKRNLPVHPEKISHISENKNPEKNLYIIGNKNSEKILILPETELFYI